MVIFYFFPENLWAFLHCTMSSNILSGAVTKAQVSP